MDDKELEAMDAAGTQRGGEVPAETQQGSPAAVAPDVFRSVVEKSADPQGLWDGVKHSKSHLSLMMRRVISQQLERLL
jgi:hypothetical protein